MLFRSSIVFGKRNGIPYVKYKGKGSPELYSEQQIHDHVHQTGKLHLLEPFLYGLKAAQHHKIENDHSYQGDVMVPDQTSNHLIGNIVKYKKPRESVSHAIAVHTHMQTSTGKKIGSNPDVSFLETSGSHFPKLDLNNEKFNISGWQPCMTNYRLIIYDRWGEKVFESADITDGWDGTFNGKPLDPAVFTYYVKARLSNGSDITKRCCC